MPPRSPEAILRARSVRRVSGRTTWRLVIQASPSPARKPRLASQRIRRRRSLGTARARSSGCSTTMLQGIASSGANATTCRSDSPTSASDGECSPTPLTRKLSASPMISRCRVGISGRSPSEVSSTVPAASINSVWYELTSPDAASDTLRSCGLGRMTAARRMPPACPASELAVAINGPPAPPPTITGAPSGRRVVTKANSAALSCAAPTRAIGLPPPSINATSSGGVPAFTSVSANASVFTEISASARISVPDLPIVSATPATRVAVVVTARSTALATVRARINRSCRISSDESRTAWSATNANRLTRTVMPMNT